MSSITRVSDSASNGPEQIAHAANVLGRSPLRRRVFGAIYHGKRKVKTVSELARTTRLSSKQVLMEAKRLVNNNIVEQVKHAGETAYVKMPFFHQNKAKILGLAADPAKLNGFATKRTPRMEPGGGVVKLTLNTARAAAHHVTIDEVESFKRVRGIELGPSMSASVSEKAFKEVVKKALGVRSNAKDWGGERNDLYTTALRFKGKRRQAAFAFKGPGTKGRLVPGKMGKNGDQIQRLLEATAEIFFVQYWAEIDQSIIEQMRRLAEAKSALNTQKPVWYGIIDGQDSFRIWQAYGPRGAGRKGVRTKSGGRNNGG